MTTVYVGDLDVNATARDLEREFSRFGRLGDIWVARNPPGFAFIDFIDPYDAKDACREMDGRYILDKRVRVEISRKGSRSHRGGRGGGGRYSERSGSRGRETRARSRSRSIDRNRGSAADDFNRDRDRERRRERSGDRNRGDRQDRSSEKDRDRHGNHERDNSRS